MEPNGHQSWVIGHHLAQVEEIPTSSYRDVSLDRLTDGLTFYQIELTASLWYIMFQCFRLRNLLTCTASLWSTLTSSGSSSKKVVCFLFCTAFCIPCVHHHFRWTALKHQFLWSMPHRGLPWWLLNEHICASELINHCVLIGIPLARTVYPDLSYVPTLYKMY